MSACHAVYSWLRLGILEIFGWVFNTVGVPGLVRDCEYDASVTRAHIGVRSSTLFTVVSVNGFDVYFRRLTGRIDGVGAGVSPNADCNLPASSCQAELSAHLGAPHADTQAKAQTESRLAACR